MGQQQRQQQQQQRQRQRQQLQCCRAQQGARRACFTRPLREANLAMHPAVVGLGVAKASQPWPWLRVRQCTRRVHVDFPARTPLPNPGLPVQTTDSLQDKKCGMYNSLQNRGFNS